MAGVVDRISEAVGFLLAHKVDIGHVGQTAHFGMPGLVFLLFQPGFQLKIAVEVILDGAFAFTRNNQNILDAGIDGFLHDVLNGGNVNDRQHFLGHGLGGGQKTGTQARGGYNGFTNRHCFVS